MPIHLKQHGFVALVEGAESVSVAELVAFLDDLAANDAARVVVLSLSGRPSPPDPLARLRTSRERGSSRARTSASVGEEPGGKREALALTLTPLPLVAALSGTVGRAALDVAGACDIRICDSETRLHSEWRTRTRASSGMHPLPAGPNFDAQAALAEGLVSEVTPPGEALTRALALAETIASRGPIATRLAKEAIWRGRAMPLSQALRFETDLTLLLQTTKDRAEGVSAFIEKRKPSFTGN